MKKLGLVAAVILVVVAPAWARVDITCSAVGKVITVKYNVVSEPNKVSGFGLDITADSGAKIKSISSLSADYWVYPGSIVILNGEVNDVGTPIGDPVRFPGTLGGLDTNGITIEMGALHDPPGDSYLPSSGTLLKFEVDKDCCVTIKENAIRGGVVLTNPALNPDVNSPGVGSTPKFCTEVPTCKGEVNGDNKVNASDVLVIAGWIGSYGTGKPKSILSTDTLHYVLSADANVDGKINASDILKIAGWIGSYGIGKPKSVACPHSYQ
jgi:hypothetical protein